MNKRVIVTNVLNRYADSMPSCPGCDKRVSVDSVLNGGKFQRIQIPGLSTLNGYFICGKCNDPKVPTDRYDEKIRNNMHLHVIASHDFALLEIN